MAKKKTRTAVKTRHQTCCGTVDRQPGHDPAPLRVSLRQLGDRADAGGGGGGREMQGQGFYHTPPSGLRRGQRRHRPLSPLQGRWRRSARRGLALYR